MKTITKAKPKGKTVLKVKPRLKGKPVPKAKPKAKNNSKTVKSSRNMYLKDLQERGFLFNRVPEENGVWQLQDAKAKFSEVVKAAQEEPQIITVHGKETAVILSYDEFIELTTPKMSAWEFFRNSPLYGVELEIPPRLVEPDRDINL